MKNKLMENFIYSEDNVPRNYGTIFTLTEFLDKVEHNHCQDFMGTGYLVLNEKIVENSKEWIADGFLKIDNKVITLENLNTIIENLKVFWISATDLLF